MDFLFVRACYVQEFNLAGMVYVHTYLCVFCMWKNIVDELIRASEFGLMFIPVRFDSIADLATWTRKIHDGMTTISETKGK